VGCVVRMSWRGWGELGSHLLLSYFYLWDPGVLVPTESNPGDQHHLSSLVQFSSPTLLPPPSSVRPAIPVPIRGWNGPSQNWRVERRQETCELPPSMEELFAIHFE
jgi:hypothetical protein